MTVSQSNGSKPSVSTLPGVEPLTRIENITKSQEDQRLYRGLKLENGMSVLLVSDPTTDKSAACLCVEVGHMSDPEDIPGIAHFLEHMLFLGNQVKIRGTEKNYISQLSCPPYRNFPAKMNIRNS